MQSALRILDTESLSQPKILLIEDSQFDVVFIKRIIESYYPYTLIDIAELKAEACELLRRNRYDIVFLDLRLPDTVDITDVKEIQLLSGSTPVIIVTGAYDEEILRQVREYRVGGIVSKNELVNQDFSTVIRNAINNIESI